MKKIITLFCIISTSILKANDLKKFSFEDSTNTIISKLQIGDSVSYKTYLNSCYSGELKETMDSICFFRDSLSLKALYKNYTYNIDSQKLEKISLQELKLLSIGTTQNTTYYYYIIEFQNGQGLLGTGEKTIWNNFVYETISK